MVSFRALYEILKVQREAREQEERAQRRWEWIGRGFTLSDYESESSEEYDRYW